MSYCNRLLTLPARLLKYRVILSKAKAANIVSKGRLAPALSAGLFGGCGLVQHPPELLLFSFG